MLSYPDLAVESNLRCILRAPRCIITLCCLSPAMPNKTPDDRRLQCHAVQAASQDGGVRYTSLQPPADTGGKFADVPARPGPGQSQQGSMLPAPQPIGGMPPLDAIFADSLSHTCLFAGHVQAQSSESLAILQVLSILHGSHPRLRLLQVVLHGLSRQQRPAQLGKRLMMASPARRRSRRPSRFGTWHPAVVQRS